MKKDKTLRKFTSDRFSTSTPSKELIEVSFPIRTETNVREAFVLVHSKLGYKILDSQLHFPKYLLKNEKGKQLNTEVSFSLWDALKQKFSPDMCDLIICWQDNLNIREKIKRNWQGKIIELSDFIKAPFRESSITYLKAQKTSHLDRVIELNLLKTIYVKGIQGVQVFHASVDELQAQIQEKTVLNILPQDIVTSLHFLASAYDFPFHEIKKDLWRFDTKKIDKCRDQELYVKVMRKRIFEQLEQHSRVKSINNAYPSLPWNVSERKHFLQTEYTKIHNKKEEKPSRTKHARASPLERPPPSTRVNHKELISFTIHNELNVREAFCYIIDRLDYTILASQEKFPDYILKDDNRSRIKAEVEVRPSHFRNHEHPIQECDLVICWVNDQFSKNLQENGVTVLVLDEFITPPKIKLKQRKEYQLTPSQRLKRRRDLGPIIEEILLKQISKKLTPIIELTKLRDRVEDEINQEIDCTTILNYFKYDTNLKYKTISHRSGTSLFFSPNELQKLAHNRTSQTV